MDKRTATLKRTTKETDIEISLDIDGAGEANVGSGIGFFALVTRSLKRLPTAMIRSASATARLAALWPCMPVSPR